MNIVLIAVILSALIGLAMFQAKKIKELNDEVKSLREANIQAANAEAETVKKLVLLMDGAHFVWEGNVPFDSCASDHFPALLRVMKSLGRNTEGPSAHRHLLHVVEALRRPSLQKNHTLLAVARSDRAVGEIMEALRRWKAEAAVPKRR